MSGPFHLNATYHLIWDVEHVQILKLAQIDIG